VARIEGPMLAKPSLWGRRAVVVEDGAVVRSTIEAVLGDAGAIVARS
jgi:hypothetical protein